MHKSDETNLPRNLFRACAGIMIIDHAGRVLACERSDIPGSWQMPQGGLKPHEEPLDAALREAFEETGIPAERLELLAEHPDWLTYELDPQNCNGRHGRGQVQKWFLFRLQKGTPIDLSRAPSDEFSDFSWMNLTDLIEITAPFRKKIYHRLAMDFTALIAD